MTVDEVYVIGQFAVFVLMIPITFRAFQAINFDVLFKRGFIWQKQALIIIWTVITAYLFSKAFIELMMISRIFN